MEQQFWVDITLYKLHSNMTQFTKNNKFSKFVAEINTLLLLPALQSVHSIGKPVLAHTGVVVKGKGKSFPILDTEHWARR